MTRNDFSELLGVSPQQIQKYEKAQDRINASSLKQIADATKKPLLYFYDKQEDTTAIINKHTFAVMEALSKISNPKTRTIIENLILTLGA